MTGGLIAQGAQVVAALESYIERSEERLAYRRDRGRRLSKAHKVQLEELRDRLKAAQRAIDALLGPSAEDLRERFEAAGRRLESLEVDDAD